MRVPVLLALPAQEPLRDLALYVKGFLHAPLPELLTTIRAKVKIPGAVRLTLDSYAVALEIGDIQDKRPLEWFAKSYAVRGFVEYPSVKDVPPEIDGQRIFSDPRIAKFSPNITSLGDSAVGTYEDVKNNLDVAKLHAAGLKGKDVAIAIMDDGFNCGHLANRLGSVNFDAVNSWSPISNSTPGSLSIGHGTMCAFAALLAAPEATLLDIAFSASIPLHAATGQSNADPTLILAMQGLNRLREFWRLDRRPPGIRALVISNSWGIANEQMDFEGGHDGRYVDNPRHLFNRQVADIVNSGVDIVFAAGNCGYDFDFACNGPQPIMGASALPGVLTIAGCDIDDTRVGYSSQGPGMLGMPEPRQKPDVTAYTHFDGSQARGSGMADVGTSTACPVAAGCVAALRSRDPTAGRPTPAQMIKTIRDTARLAHGQTVRDDDHGCGIINPLEAARRLGIYPPRRPH